MIKTYKNNMPKLVTTGYIMQLVAFVNDPIGP
jgi:hypothetical protein